MLTRLALMALLLAPMASAGEVDMLTDKLHWLGHDTFRIDGPPIIYIDPYKLREGLPPADLILITHGHQDHCSPADIGKIRSSKTVIVGPQEAASKIAGLQVMAAGQTRELAGVKIKAVAAYNTNKNFHPQADGKLGFVFTVGGVTYYHAGDTDNIPEMAGLAPDVALLPVSGTYVMTASEAAEAAKAIKPKVAVPMHYGTIVGSDADARTFAKLLEKSCIQVVIKQKE